MMFSLSSGDFLSLIIFCPSSIPPGAFPSSGVFLVFFFLSTTVFRTTIPLLLLYDRFAKWCLLSKPSRNRHPQIYCNFKVTEKER